MDNVHSMMELGEELDIKFEELVVGHAHVMVHVLRSKDNL